VNLPRHCPFSQKTLWEAGAQAQFPRALTETIASGGVRVAVAELRRAWYDGRDPLQCTGPLLLLTLLCKCDAGRRELLDCAVPAQLLRMYVNLPNDESLRDAFLDCSPPRIIHALLEDIDPDTTHAELRHLSDVGFDADALALLLLAVCKAAEWRDDDALAHAVDAICAACAPERGRLGLRNALLTAGARVALAGAAKHARGRPPAEHLLQQATGALGLDTGLAAATRRRNNAAAASGSKPQARSAAELAAAEAAADAAMAALLAEEDAEQRPAAAVPGTRKKNRNKKRGGGDASGSGSAAASDAAATLPDDAGDVDGGAGALDASPDAASEIEPPPQAPAPLPPAGHPTLLPPAPPAVVVAAPPAPPPPPAPPVPVAASSPSSFSRCNASACAFAGAAAAASGRRV
jgi:hypothetical protein